MSAIHPCRVIAERRLDVEPLDVQLDRQTAVTEWSSAGLSEKPPEGTADVIAQRISHLVSAPGPRASAGVGASTASRTTIPRRSLENRSRHVTVASRAGWPAASCSLSDRFEGHAASATGVALMGAGPADRTTVPEPRRPRTANLYQKYILYIPSGGEAERMFQSETRVLVILPRDLVDRARVLAGRATTSMRLPVSVQIVLRALIEEGLKRPTDPGLLGNVSRQAETVRRIRREARRRSAGPPRGPAARPRRRPS